MTSIYCTSIIIIVMYFIYVTSIIIMYLVIFLLYEYYINRETSRIKVYLVENLSPSFEMHLYIKSNKIISFKIHLIVTIFNRSIFYAIELWIRYFKNLSLSTTI